jgi:hypothetical protein
MMDLRKEICLQKTYMMLALEFDNFIGQKNWEASLTKQIYRKRIKITKIRRPID